MDEKKYIECGKIINTHGCRGGVKLESWCDSPEILAGLKCIYLRENGEYKPHKIIKSAVFRQFVLFDLENIDNMDKALALKNTVVFAQRADFHLAEGDYFISDVIGLDVTDADTGRVYGKVTDIVNRGASDIYVVETTDGEKMLPAVPEFVQKVDIEKGLLSVRPIEGLLD